MKKELRFLAVTAMLIALSVVVGVVCKNYFTFSVYYRVTFENFPIIAIGLLFGPVPAGISAVIADFISCMFSGGGVNPIISLGAVAVGVISGCFKNAVRKEHPLLCTAAAVALSHLVGQVAIKSVAKVLMLGMPLYGIAIGLVISAAVGVVEFIILRQVLFGAGLLKKYGDNT